MQKDARGLVIDYETKEEKEITMGLNLRSCNPSFQSDQDFQVYTTFGEAGSMSCGFIYLKAQGIKPNKNSGRHVLVLIPVLGLFCCQRSSRSHNLQKFIYGRSWMPVFYTTRKPV